MSDVVLCDFDGTISVKDVTDSLLERFAGPDWQGLEEMWEEGLISSAQCMTSQYALIRTCQVKFDEFLDRMKIDPHFVDFYEHVKDDGYEFAVVSDGFDYYIERILSNHGLSGLTIYANHLSWQNGEIKTHFPHINDECRTCGNCKTSIYRKYKTDGNKVIYVGDGWSDRCIAQQSDVIYAKGKLIKFCHENGISYTPYLTFSDIMRDLFTSK